MNYPFGKPSNRDTGPAKPVPVPDRPNWFTPPQGGEPYYVEPEKPAPQAELFEIDWSIFHSAHDA